MGTRSRLRPVWRSYGVNVERTPDDVRHTAVVHPLDRNGHVRAAYIVPFQAENLVSDARALARN